ncbi:sulfotransferase [Gracilimonas sp.]|uniref:sulfotransferase n=1 Tax=Gracilimonas sp. TaxID=1974203 RepID=UPI003BABB172
MPEDFKKLNEQRTGKYHKPAKEESFLEGLNNTLEKKETEEYINTDINHPLIFVIGLPRSGTTLLTQTLAHGLDVSYINNIAARFWAAPLHGLKLSDSLLDGKDSPYFRSDYATTHKLNDIHEFGYFWRKWLKKDSFEHIIHAEDYEPEIDWNGLKKVLGNLTSYRDKAFIFKNIFGAFHMSKLNQVLEKTLWIYIERDILDVAVSNLNARKKFYDDPNTWWSTAPPEFPKLKDLETIPQIAGQLHYLKRFYHREMNNLNSEGKGLHITYDELCKNPSSFLKVVQENINSLYHYKIPLNHELPDSFSQNKYEEDQGLKKEFEKHLIEFHKNDPIPELN